MKTAKDLSQASFRSGDTFAKKVSTCKRLASGIASVRADGDLGLTDKELEALSKATSLLGEIATLYAKAAKLKKHAEALRAQRQKDVRAAMRGTFDALATTADKVALIASVQPYTFTRGGIGCDLTKPGDVAYLMGRVFNECLDDIAYSAAVSSAADMKDVAPAAAAALYWQRFVDRRAQLQDKYAQVIVRVERALAGEATCS